MKKPSKSKPRSHRGAGKRRPAKLAVAVTARTASPSRRAGRGPAPGYAFVSERRIGLLPPSPARAATAARVRSVAAPRTEADLLALLTLPMLAMMIAFSLQPVPTSWRYSSAADEAQGPVLPLLAPSRQAIAQVNQVGADPAVTARADPPPVVLAVTAAGAAVRSIPVVVSLDAEAAPTALTQTRRGLPSIVARTDEPAIEVATSSALSTPDVLSPRAAPAARADHVDLLAVLIPSPPFAGSSEGTSALIMPQLPPTVAAHEDPADAPPVCLRVERPAPAVPQTLSPAAFGAALAQAARAQTGDFVIYNDTYRTIAYPMGDVAPLYGVCTDVVIRAYRAVGIDLQRLVHESGLGSGDSSIEHRRTEILRRFFSRYGEALPPSPYAEDYRPGDIVTYDRPQNRHSRAHIAVVSDTVGRSGRYMIVHNRGWGPQIEDALFVDQITGHYRYAGGVTAPAAAGQRPPCAAGARAAGQRSGCGAPFTSARARLAPRDGMTAVGLGR